MPGYEEFSYAMTNRSMRTIKTVTRGPSRPHPKLVD